MVVLSLRHINILKIRVLTPFREPPYLRSSQDEEEEPRANTRGAIFQRS